MEIHPVITRIFSIFAVDEWEIERKRQALKMMCQGDAFALLRLFEPDEEENIGAV